MSKPIPYSDKIRNKHLKDFYNVDEHLLPKNFFEGSSDDLGGHDDLAVYYDKSLDEE